MAFLFAAGAAGAQDLWYAAKGSTEAVLDFSASVELSAARTPDSHLVLQAIESQVLHLFGPMAAADNPGVPRTDHRITGVRLRQKEAGLYVADYHYRGTVVVRNGPRTRYDIVLPVRPARVYEQALVRRGNRWFNPCTDPHYQDEGDFWYFWNPDQRGCRLKEGEHFVRVRGALERIPNTRLTYPEYERLADAEGTIRFDVFFGMDDASHSLDPMRSQDYGAKGFRGFRRHLLAAGFTEQVLGREEVRRLLGRKVSLVPFLSVYRWQGKKASLAIRVYYGPTGITEATTAFHLLFADALARSAVVIHDGHSGLGSDLDLEAIERLRRFRLQPAKDRYQIYYFNSCSSYPYYARDYFGRKRTARDPRGTKNLDILTNGLAAPFDPESHANLALVRAVQRWAGGYAKASYQRLAELIETDTLFGVNGDEDNP